MPDSCCCLLRLQGLWSQAVDTANCKLLPALEVAALMPLLLLASKF